MSPELDEQAKKIKQQGWSEGYHQGRMDAVRLEMESGDRVAVCVMGGVVAYIVVAFLVFGWYHNHHPYVECTERYCYGYPPYDGWVMGNIAGSALWPFRLAGEFAIWVTRWP